MLWYEEMDEAKLTIGVNNSLLLTVGQVASLLAISPRTVWSKVASGSMPAPVRIGRLCRWRREDIEKWVAQGCPKLNSVEYKK
jgi:excisionase family DNA binding protein